MEHDQLIAATNEELAFYITTTTKSLTEAIGEVYRRDADKKQADMGKSLTDLAFAASSALGYGPGLMPGSETDVTNYDAGEAVEETISIDEPEALTVKDVAAIYNIGEQTIRNLVKKRRLSTVGKVKHGKPTYIRVNQLFYREAGKRGITTFPWSAA